MEFTDTEKFCIEETLKELVKPMPNYGKCCICQQPFKVGDHIKRIQDVGISEFYGQVVRIPWYTYCLQCYSVHIEKND